jgi:hypothetical protein
MDINITVNVDGKQAPKVEVNKAPVVKRKQTKRFGGVLQFPAPKQPSGVLDILGIRET